MSIDKKIEDSSPSVNLDLSGSVLRRREQQVGALDPYDTRRTFKTVKEPTELFRRRREDMSDEPQEQEKRIKFEIVDEAGSGPKGPKGGYDPYDAS